MLQTRGLSVRFGPTSALEDVSLELRRGEVHAVVGENGAGKSTLLRCLAGALSPTSGHIESAKGIRVAWVPQEPELPPNLTAREWIFLAEEWVSPWGFLRRRYMDDAARGALSDVGAGFPPESRLGTLTAPQRKQVQLARALRQEADVLLLDEPTAVLGASESDALFALVRGLRQRGGAVLYVSHRLDEVRVLADRVSVLRDGHHVATSAAGEVPAATLVEQMVGRAIPEHRHLRRILPETSLTLRGLCVGHVQDVTLSVQAGEIVGLAGLLGAGRSEVLEAIAGIVQASRGYISHVRPLALVAEDRSRKGLVPQFDVRRNLFLPAPSTWLWHQEERRQAAGWIQRLPILAPDVDAPIATLSGGNQQKVLLARALRQSPKVLLLDEPTAGIDVGAKAQIHDVIGKLAFEGTAVLLASSDLPELLTLCDRILALRNGRVVGSFEATSTSEAQLAACITGANVPPPPAPAPGFEAGPVEVAQ